jgi:hypothetical protein
MEIIKLLYLFILAEIIKFFCFLLYGVFCRYFFPDTFYQVFIVLNDEGYPLFFFFIFLLTNI